MIYTVVLLIVNLSAFFSVVKVNRSFLFFLVSFVVLLLVVFSGSRFETGNDWGNYTSFFERYEVSSFYDFFNQKFESGYSFLNYFVKLMGGDVGYVFMISSFLSIFLLILGLRNYNVSIVFVLLLYMRYSFLQTNFMFVRQGIALAIFFFSIQFIISRRLFFYSISITIASLFHISAVVLYPLYFFSSVKFNRIYYIFLFFIALILMKLGFYNFIISLIPIDALRDTAVAYANSEVWGRSSLISFSTVERFFIVLFFYYIIFFSKHEVGKEMIVFFNIYYIGFIIYILFFEKYIFAERFSIYFNVCAMYLLAVSLRFFKDIFSKVIFFFAVSIFVWGYYTKTVFSGGMDSVFLPYKSFLL